MAKSKYIEALEEQYTKKDAKSVLRYKAPDNKWRYVQTSKGASGGNMVEVKWQELKDKRDNGELNPGSLYRITDYNCTTTQENTQSAGHQFDIVLLALSENKLAEEGWAMMHENDTYFANSNLSAWKVWYCLDNDTSRFYWEDDTTEESISTDNDLTFVRTPDFDRDGFKAFYNASEDYHIGIKQDIPIIGEHPWILDEEPYEQDSSTIIAYSGFGRGVIYRLIDEWGNDCSYDFKNIMYAIPITDGDYDEEGEFVWLYTFSSHGGSDATDMSLSGTGNNVIQNSTELPYLVLLVSANGVNLINCDSCVFVETEWSTLINCSSIYNTSLNQETDSYSIYINNKKVLTEE